MKAVLIMDMPERCSMCEFIKKTDEGYCYCGRLGFDFSVNDYMKSTPIGKPDWCPLKEIPQEDNNSYYPDEYQDGYADGWNACIRKLLEGVDSQ